LCDCSNRLQAIRSNSVDCVRWVMEMQLDPKAEHEPLNIQGNFLSQCSTSFQDFSPYDSTKYKEPPDCCSVAELNSESLKLSHGKQTLSQQTAQVNLELVMKFFQEDLDTSPVLVLSHSTLLTANCIFFKLILTIISLRLFRYAEHSKSHF
jgi:hypothetical protein